MHIQSQAARIFQWVMSDAKQNWQHCIDSSNTSTPNSEGRGAPSTTLNKKSTSLPRRATTKLNAKPSLARTRHMKPFFSVMHFWRSSGSPFDHISIIESLAGACTCGTMPRFNSSQSGCFLVKHCLKSTRMWSYWSEHLIQLTFIQAILCFYAYSSHPFKRSLFYNWPLPCCPPRGPTFSVSTTHSVLLLGLRLVPNLWVRRWEGIAMNGQQTGNLVQNGAPLRHQYISTEVSEPTLQTVATCGCNQHVSSMELTYRKH